MPQRDFSSYIAYIQKADEFIKNQKSIFEKYLKVSPDDLLRPLEDIIQKNFRQENLKKSVPQLTRALEKEIEATFTKMSSKVKIIKGILEDKGKLTDAKSLPAPSSAKRLDTKMSWLLSFKTFIEEYKSDLEGYPQIDSTSISNIISELSQKKKVRDDLENEKRDLTKYIEKNLDGVVKDTTNWLRVAEGLLGIEKKTNILKNIPRQPRGKGKKVING